VARTPAGTAAYVQQDEPAALNVRPIIGKLNMDSSFLKLGRIPLVLDMQTCVNLKCGIVNLYYSALVSSQLNCVQSQSRQRLRFFTAVADSA
jgi:hypothetical protein